MKKSNIRNKINSLKKRYSDSPHRSFKKTSRQSNKKSPIKIKESWRLILDSAIFMSSHKRFFVWLVLTYAIVSYLLVGGVSLTDYNSLRESSDNFLNNGLDAVTTAMAYFGAALSGGLTEAPSEMQQFLGGLTTLIFWLVIIWGVRMISAGEKIKVRDAFYNGLTPLITTTLILIVVLLQLIPAALGLFGFSILLTENWVTNLAQGLAYGAAALLLCLVSLYWISGSVIALVVVALPGMRPLEALVNARLLVMGKRWEIMIRVMAGFVIQLIFWAFIMIPLFMLDNWLSVDWLPLVPVAIQLMSAISLAFTSTYIYKMYRSML